MNQEVKSSLKSFIIELVVYAALVVGYFLLVLEFLGDWLHRVYMENPHLYAFLALALIVCQGVVLEILTRVLLDLIKPRMRD
ncbi:MAG TPA: hypothetical protein VFA77_00085 [Candidatus Eisenbacteria bacterium]|jgi:hypothetical protein|nr:hypothetical protein [Candidatus Eisenbacteria bacterium]